MLPTDASVSSLAPSAIGTVASTAGTTSNLSSTDSLFADVDVQRGSADGAAAAHSAITTEAITAEAPPTPEPQLSVAPTPTTIEVEVPSSNTNLVGDNDDISEASTQPTVAAKKPVIAAKPLTIAQPPTTSQENAA